MSGSLVIPIAIWGKNPVTHCVSSILMTPDQSHIVTGCHDGHLAIWLCEEKFKVSPQMILFGHTSPVTCLAMASTSDEQNYVVSSSDNGELCLWDLSDGRCLEHIKMSIIHTCIQSHQLLENREMRLICNGYYPDILIMHPKRLEVLLTLSSNVQPDWITALCVLRPINQEENVVAVTNSGLVKVWTIPTGFQQGTQIYENESKQTRCLNAKMLKCCIYNQRTVLIVCTKYWQIYDACDFSVLCSESSRIGERWMGGEFISAYKVIVWSNRGRGYLYHLPSNTNPNSSSYRSSEQEEVSAPLSYLVFDLPCDKPLDCSPVMTYILKRREGDHKLLLRGDSMGRICIWVVSSQDGSQASLDGEGKNPRIVRQTSFENLPVMKPSGVVTWFEEWSNSLPQPEGILDHLNNSPPSSSQHVQVTSTVFMSSSCSLACGRSDGSIIIMSATQAISRQLFKDPNATEAPLPHKLLLGHKGRVNCLLYPHNESARYHVNHLVSGGQDFCVLLWDILQGTKLFCFCVHGGEILQLIVPPDNCNSRVLVSVCAIASDHSLSLLSLRDRKCILLASRQLFPIQVVKWRPHDDFVVIGTTDGTVYVWQMETGHLDRVVHGVAADDILSACDEKCDATEKLSNPTVTVTQALRRHNMATFKHLAQQHLKKAQDAIEQKNSSDKAPHPSLIQKTQSLLPMAVQGLRSNPKDSDSHVVYFNAEALIVQLLSEEYSSLSPNTLENLGFYTKVLQDQGLSDTQKIFVDIFSKVRNKADDVSKKIQSKVDTSVKTSSSQSLSSGSSQHSCDSLGVSRPDPPTRPKNQSSFGEPEVGSSSTITICQILMSCLHAWELDHDVDKLCLSKLGLLKPNRTVSFGYLSPGGHMSLGLPSAKRHPSTAILSSKKQPETVQERFIQSSKNPFFQDQEFNVVDGAEFKVEQVVDVKIHWQISSAVTTQHLLSIISLTNTLMSMSNATFVKSRQTLKKELESPPSSEKRAEGGNTAKPAEISDSVSDINSMHQSQNKQGWSLLAALHCVLLPDLVGKMRFKPPQLEMLARRWQDRCLEIREASQALLLAELRRLGPDGRRAVVSEWSQYLPIQTDPLLTFMTSETHSGSQGGVTTPMKGVQYGSNQSFGGAPVDDDDDDDDDGTLDGSEYLTGGLQHHRSTSGLHQHSKHATAIVMMGVVGAEFGVSIEGQRSKDNNSQKKTSATSDATGGNNGGVADGFSVCNYAHARHTSKALASLLLQPSTHGISIYSLIRRAAVDLLGRGFMVWEPYLDVSSILIGLLELCIDGDKLVPSAIILNTNRHSMTFGLPLTSRADACRTARHALALIATARPATFVITMAKEVARYNAMTQNAQSQNYHHSLHAAVLGRAKTEIVRVLELLIDKQANDLVDHLSELTDVTIHCIDPNQVKVTGLQDAFPAYCRKFPMVSYCHSTRRIAVGTKTGNLLFYDLKQGKCQSIHAHGGPIHVASFAPDGKSLASFSLGDNKLLFWQTAASSLFSLGSHQIKCIKSFTTHSIQPPPSINLLKNIILCWHDNRTVGLQLWDKIESRFRL